MLRRWHISNFKSIPPGAPPLELAPLTLVSGVNSSGKSTLIQSILLVAQTVGSRARDRALILNGELVKLGYVSDVLHHGRMSTPPTNSSLDFGFELETEDLPGFRSSPLEPNGASNRLVVKTSLQPSTGTSPEAPEAKLHVVQTHLDMGSSMVICHALQKGEGGLLSEGEQNAKGRLAEQIKRGDFDYRVEELGKLRGTEEGQEKGPFFCSLMHFLPESRLTWGISLREALALVARFLAIGENKLPGGLEFGTSSGAELRDELSAALGYARSRAAVRSDVSVQELTRAQDLLRVAHDIPNWANMLSKQEDLPKLPSNTARVISARAQVKVKPIWLGVTEPQARDFPLPVWLSRHVIQEYFVERVKYLGPLRDNPRLIYGIPADPDSQDVGLVGEYTAFVLERHGAEVVTCPLPPRGEVPQQQFESKSLRDSVILWLAHMDLAKNVKTHDRGKIGIEFKLRVPGLEEEVDLTNIGVGVSQVLPMLTLCLLAPVGGLVLMEQPELHLHPKLQAQLGDFLLGIAARGTQCIIETHSEWLINRVRRRIAEAPGDSVMRQVRIYFAEKEGSATKFRPVEPNRFGAIAEWPIGFFDEGPDEAERIIEAATRKMQAERQEKMPTTHGKRGASS